MLVDSHCHLDFPELAGRLDQVLADMATHEVGHALCVCVTLTEFERVLEVAARDARLSASVGVHPDYPDTVEPDVETLVRLAAHPKVVAIGETGLDYDRVFSPIADQLTNLRRNLALAADTGRPAILHCRSAAGRRDAQDALFAEIRAIGQAAPPPLIHSFSGPVDYARAMLDLGAVISFSGLVFRRGEEASAEVAAAAPADRVLVETDSPFLAAPGAPRSRNEPEWVRVTGAWLAERRATEPDGLGSALVATYDRVFARSR